MRNLVWLVALALAVVVAAGCVGFFSLGAPQRSHEEINQTIADSNPVISAVSRETDPNLVPIPTAFNQSLAEFWSFTIDGPYSSDPNWTTAALDPEPVILYDINGKPQYYEFYLRDGGTIPGYFWTSANKLMGHGISRLYQGAPSYNHSQIALDAEKVVKMRYPDYPLVSDVPALYGGGYPMLCRMIMIQNTSNGTDERVVVDAFTLEIVPDHPSEDYKGSEYAWSYLDSVTQSEWPDRIAQWELQESNASGIVAYAMSQGIEVRLPLSPQNANIIRNYSAAVSPGPSSPEPDSTPAVPDARPITDELIRENEVPVDTARVQAQSTLWDRQVDRPDISDDLSYRNATISSREPATIEDFMGRKLYYVFGVERDGVAVGEIIVVADKGVYSHPWGLETPTGEYDIADAVQKARETAAQDFPGSVVLSTRPVYSLADNCCHNVTVMMDLEDPQTLERNRIHVDTYTLNSRVEPVTGNEDTEAYPSLFSRLTPADFADNARRWEEDDKKDRDLVAYAQSEGIYGHRPLTDTGIVALGAYITRTSPTYEHPPAFNPLYPGPAVLPTLSKETLAWHEQADWFSVIDVDASLSDADISRIIGSHRILYNYTLKVFPASLVRRYYLRVPEADYNRTFSVLTSDGSAGPEPETVMWDYVTFLKRENGTITIPVGIGVPEEANFLRLKGEGVLLRQMKTAYINFDPGVKKAEREKILAELNEDDRVLFARREWSG
ncbi:MAG: hypothetical protein ABSB80_00335 [Methanoregula sp.]|jgi:hypothetical protein|uniref:hypothetical protein n=1 Tax=Methanoregula sp. TaxID=2052170 RepID=UPI003D14DEE3